MFKGVGTALLRFARLLSVELGYEGRVGLHSLPGAERFYEKQGMLDYGSEEDYDNLETLLSILLTSSDWETIATAAANSIREQVIHRVDAEKISA
ncbi:hypothetical protein NUACC21_73180 [Scytonema sp. NUACC21]